MGDADWLIGRSDLIRSVYEVERGYLGRIIIITIMVDVAKKEKIGDY